MRLTYLLAFLSLSTAAFAQSDEITVKVEYPPVPTIDSEVQNLDIVGLKIGGTADEIRKVLFDRGCEKIDFHNNISETRDVGGVKVKLSGVKSYVPSMICKLKRDGGDEYFEVFFTSAVTGNRAHQISRKVQYYKEAPVYRDDFVKAIFEKYGDPDQRQDGEGMSTIQYSWLFGKKKLRENDRLSVLAGGDDALNGAAFFSVSGELKRADEEALAKFNEDLELKIEEALDSRSTSKPGQAPDL